jgi:hypothetical protein
MVTHRIEMGVWERDHVEPILTAATVASYGLAASAVAAAAGIGLAGVATFYALKTAWDFGKDLKETIVDTGQKVETVIDIASTVSPQLKPLSWLIDRLT